MRVVFELSGTVIFETEMNHTPQIGTEVQFRTITYKKGLRAGSLISMEVGSIDPPVYYLESGQPPEVHISANGYNLIEEGIDPDDA